MKKLLLTGFIGLCSYNGMFATGVQQRPLPTSVSDDAELMFDEVPDALDAVTSKDCNCSDRVANAENQTLLQSCYQTALMYLFISYLTLQYSCESVKQYVASLLAWKPAIAVPTSSEPGSSMPVSE